jgi:8-oxo-dGTP pyrophosphatase MutT (NUDIX family)
MARSNVLYVEKACAYITRNGSELLTFEGPGHDGLQIPKGTVEPGENPQEAVYREIVEESGLAAVEGARHLVTDVWQRRHSPPKRYVRNFYHVPVHEPRDEWTHVVTGTGEEVGAEFSFSWVELGTDERFALDLDDYVHALPGSRTRSVDARPGVTAD